LGKKQKTINVKDVDEETWNHFGARVKIQKVTTGALLTEVLNDYLLKKRLEEAT